MSVQSPRDVASNTPGNSLLSFLSGNGSGNSISSKLFANFLSQTQSLTVPVGKPNSFAPHSVKNYLANGDASSALPAIKKLSSALQQVMQKMPNQQGPKNLENTQRSNVVKTDNTQAPHKTEKNADNVVVKTTLDTEDCISPIDRKADVDASVKASADEADVSLVDDQQKIADALAELQQLVLMFEKKLKAMLDTALFADQANAVTAAQDKAVEDAKASEAGDAKDPLTAALDQLLLLVLEASQKLEKTETGSEIATEDATAEATLVAHEDLSADAQIKADLKALLDALKAGAQTARNEQKESVNNEPALATKEATEEMPLAKETETSIKVAAQPIPDAFKTAPLPKDNLLGLFQPSPNDAPDNQPATSFTPMAANVAASVGDKGGAAAGFDMNAQNRDASLLTRGTPQNMTMPVADGVKTVEPYNFAHLLSASRTTSGGTTGMPNAVEQVILQLQRNVKNGASQMTLQLNPAELGRIHIKLNFAQDGKVHGMVIADNPATLDILLKDVRSLERALQEAGLRADPGSLQFSLGGQAENPFAHMTGDGETKKSTVDPLAIDDVANDLSDVSDNVTDTYYLTPGRVNLRV